MKKFAAQAILLLLVIIGAMFYYSPVSKNSKIEIPFLPHPLVVKSLEVNGSKLKVEIADTDSKRNKGLSGRDSLGIDEGMLFVYSKPGAHPFWMKGMRFSLDFVWINNDKVVDIIPNVPPPSSGSKDVDLPIYSSKNEADKILEVSAGTVQRLNIKVGDTISLK